MNASGASTYTYSCGSNMISPAVGTNTFTVMGTSAQGCTSSTPATATVVVNALPVITVNSGSICLGSVFVMHPSGALTYTYSSGSNAVSPSATSSYSVTGTDLYGCQSASAAVATVTVNLPPSLSVNSGSMCAGSTFTMIPSGALTYTYSSGSNTVSPSSSTSYSVTGTDVNGCVSSTAAVSTVTVNTVPVINVNSGVICAGQSFTMVPSGATTYTYSNGSNVVNPLVGISTFSVSGTNAAGCISTTQAVSSVTVNALPVIAVNSGAICRGSVFVFSPSGAITYTYTGGSNTVNPTITSTYSVTGTNAQGCISATPAVATVTVYTLPTVSVNSGSICAGSTFTMAPSGAVTYSYTSGSSVVSPATTASYSVTGTDAHGCVSATAAISTVTVNALPVISVNSGSMCAGASFTLNPSGAASYTISGGSQVVSPASTTSYSVMGTSVSGCLSASPIIATVTVNALPTISASNGSICVGQTFTLNPIGAASYTYSSGTNTVTPTSTSTYTIAGTSAAGCSTAAPITVTVTVNALPVISVNGGSICAGSSFTMNPSGAVTYTYSSGSNVVTPFVTSTYSVTGTDSHGCHSASPAMATVTVNSLPTLTINTDHLCFALAKQQSLP